MYKIYADDTLIYDSTIEDYKIGKGSISLETNKSGSFTFSLYPDHFFYDEFVRLKTVITVFKSGKIVFRGRILNDVSDYWNNKVITCEGELGFLQDSIIRPYTFDGTPEELFIKFIEEHNSQVDEFKRFNIGEITVVDSNNRITRSNSGYESALNNVNSRLIEDSLGGYLFITHGKDGADPIPTINYIVDFTKVSSQSIEFGSNLKNYTKTVKAENIATAIIPLGAEIDNGDESTEKKKLTIAEVNNGCDYVYSEEGVALYGWIFKTVPWDDVTIASNLKKKAEDYLEEVVKSNVTIELTAVDLHLLDRSIESFGVGDYVRVFSMPHKFDATLLCQKQTIDLLKPDNDTITLGHTYSAFTANSAKSLSKISTGISDIRSEVSKLTVQQKSYMDPNSQLSQLLALSLGFFQSVETLDNGSSIYYLHNAHTLEGSTTIWKLTAGAFAVSTDGGKTWNAGITSDGNVVVNLLSAIGIVADWIKTGRIESKDGNSFWDLDEGLLKLVGNFVTYSEDGNKALELLKTNIVFYDWVNKNSDIITGRIGSTSSGLSISSYSSQKLRMGYTSSDDPGQVNSVITIDEERCKTGTPWIKNTASGTLFPDNNEGIVVENGLIKDWNLQTVSATLNVVSNIEKTGDQITGYARLKIQVKNGLIANWSTEYVPL